MKIVPQGMAGPKRDYVDYARKKGGVWFATRLDIANWWHDHHHEFETYPSPPTRKAVRAAHAKASGMAALFFATNSLSASSTAGSMGGAS